jgi:hypothetical protein
MSLKKLVGVFSLLIGFAIALSPAMGQDNKGTPPKSEEPKKPGDPKKAEPAKSGAAESNAEMDAWMKSMAVGKQHEMFKGMVGKWEQVAKHRMDASMPWTENKGTAEYKLLMGGRFVQQEIKGQPMMEGMPPFEGFGLTGYDNVLSKYVSTWVDNMGTGVMISYGTADATGKVITYVSEFPDPMTGKLKKSKSISKFKDDKTHVFEMYDTGADGKEYMMLEVTYTKK